MGIVIWVVVGLVLGLLAKMIFDTSNVVVCVVLGAVGAALAGWIATLFGVGAWNAVGLVNQLIAAAGSGIVLFVGNKLLGERAA